MLARVELVVEFEHRQDAFLQGRGSTFIRTGQQHRELIAANACCTGRCIHSLRQHLANTAQHGVSRRMALLVVHHLEPIEVDGDDGQRPGALAGQTVEFLGVKRPVAQLREHIVLAQVLQIGFSLLARRDVHQRQEHQPPVAHVIGQHRELHVDMHRIARQCVVDHFALLEGLALPQVQQLLRKGLVHLPAKYPSNVVQQHLLALCAEHAQGLLVHVNHPDFVHATCHELGMHPNECLEIANALRTHTIEQALDRTEVLHPQGHGRMFEQVASVPLTTA